MEKEVWKFIDDRYQISNYGNFRKNYKNKIKNIKVYENSNGYLKAKIYKNCKYKHMLCMQRQKKNCRRVRVGI